MKQQFPPALIVTLMGEERGVGEVTNQGVTVVSSTSVSKTATVFSKAVCTPERVYISISCDTGKCYIHVNTSNDFTSCLLL
jgi:hypothetical protein